MTTVLAGSANSMENVYVGRVLSAIKSYLSGIMMI